MPPLARMQAFLPAFIDRSAPDPGKAENELGYFAGSATNQSGRPGSARQASVVFKTRMDSPV